MSDYIFERCEEINDLLGEKRDNEARQELIKLLDYHKQNDLPYSPMVNHFIRETGLFPYLKVESANWIERFAHEAFKVDVGLEEKPTLHREQSFLLKKLLQGVNVAVSAPTSFGKSFVIDAYIKLTNPTNVLIIVPTIALTDETRRRLYKKFAGTYKVITTSNVEPGDKNIFIFPQERALGYVAKIKELDMLIVDEFYKASADFDKDRSPGLVKAIIKLGAKAKQKYYLAPNISTLEKNPFTEDMDFFKMEFNTVFLEKHELFHEINRDEFLKTTALLKILRENPGKALIYAGTYTNINKISGILQDNLPDRKVEILDQFSDWLARNYDPYWNLTRLVKKGVGIHNGRLHRSLSQIQVRLFEEATGIQQIISTSSIIEGVNTSAENVIIWMNKNGQSNLNDFSYKNLIGRGGRMFRHFIGKIFILDRPPVSQQTQLNIQFPEMILGDLDVQQHQKMLSSEQVAKIMSYNAEMSRYLGAEVFAKLKNEGAFNSSDFDLLLRIAADMYNNRDSWNGLSFLNTFQQPANWDYYLYKIINFQPGNWEAKNSQLVEFIKALRNNWSKGIPELLEDLEAFDIDIQDFFHLERTVSYKFSALVQDVNTIQKVVLKNKNYDISRFCSWLSHAFLPAAIFELEEYGMPRTISKKLHTAGVLNFLAEGFTLEVAIGELKMLGAERVKSVEGIEPFERYIIDYFFDGVSLGSEWS